MKSLHIIAFLLVVVGGLNWLALGAFGWELGSLLGGQDAVASRVLYIIIGLAAAYELFAHKTRCKECLSGGEGNMEGGM
ncbi:DUF378 domain-containing protein [candidate division KSB1 bacterium]